MSKPCNVIYFVTHDSGRYFGCYGRPMQTPNIDRFAASGIRFDQSYCSSPACAPSRCCAMTGLYASRHGCQSVMRGAWDLPPEQRTIVDHLNEAGYETFHAGFCHERPYGEMRYEHDGVPGEERLWKDRADLVVDNAIRFLREERDSERPFYMNLGSLETHAASIRRDLDGVHGGPMPPEQSHVPPTLPDDDYTRRWWQGHAASTHFLDTHFGRLIDVVDELGLQDDTLIVFTTDHGIWQNRAKAFVTGEGTEIALLLRPPGRLGLAAGQQRDELIPNIDYMPTILEACGLPIPDDIDGRSFWPLVCGDSYQAHEHIVIERNYHGEKPVEGQTDHDNLYDPMRCVRSKEYAYIRYCEPAIRPQELYHWEIEGWTSDPGVVVGSWVQPRPSRPRPEIEFYDVRRDALETINLAKRIEYQGIIDSFEKKLTAWQHAVSDQVLSGYVPTSAVEVRQRPRL